MLELYKPLKRNIDIGLPGLRLLLVYTLDSCTFIYQLWRRLLSCFKKIYHQPMVYTLALVGSNLYKVCRRLNCFYI